MKDFKNYGEQLAHERKIDKVIGTGVILFVLFMSWLTAGGS